MALHLSPTELRKMADTWAATGVPDDLVRPIVEQMDKRRRDLKQQHDAYKTDRANRARTIVDRLADGDITLTDALIERAVLADTSHEADRETANLVQAALALTARTVARHFRQHFHTLEAMLIDADRTAVARATELGPLVADVDTADAAMESDNATREAWSELVTIVERRTALRDSYRQIIRFAEHRATGIGPQGDYYRFRTADAKRLRPLKGLHPVRQLTDAIALGFGPGLYTDADALAHEHAESTGQPLVEPPAEPPRWIENDNTIQPTDTLSAIRARETSRG